MKILILDDQRSARRVLAQILAGIEDVSTVEATSLEEARAIIGREPCDVAFIDLRLADDTRNRDGLVFIRELREKTTTVPIVVSAYSEMAEIRAAMRFGAYDYVLKDDLCEELVEPVIRELRQRGELESEVLRLRARCSFDQMPGNLVGGAACMDRLRQAIRRTALSDRPALVMGPSGSGKELVVRALHALGPHPDEPLIDLNCSAIPEPLVESQLFGHERGAFTGADRRADGYLAAVGRGTLFLDEIAELPASLQVKLLRSLEQRTITRVGGVDPIRVDVRLVAATNRDLEKMVKDGAFRQDLYFRLKVVSLTLPPLRERGGDILLLAEAFLAEANAANHRAVKGLATRPAPRWNATAGRGTCASCATASSRP
jgi:two-component system response regulator HydG